MMKKLICMMLGVMLLISVTGCSSLFSDDSIVQLGDYYTHEDPEKLEYDERIALLGSGFDAKLEEYAMSMAYPDTMVYDENGQMIGLYDYDETTGIAKGWTSLTDGTYTEFPAGAEPELGLPDASKMIDIPGEVALGFVVYGNKGSAVSTYMYAFLTDAAAKDLVIANTEEYFGITLTAQSDTVLTAELDSARIAEDFAMLEATDDQSANAYADFLMQSYGVMVYGGENPYKPYADHEDPADLDFDERTVLTCSGEWAVVEEYVDYMSCMTDYIYGKDGVVVAHYTYYECDTKEHAEELLENNAFGNTAELVADNVIRLICSGQSLEEMLTMYQSYSILKDDSFDEYVKMVQETYFSMVCE